MVAFWVCAWVSAASVGAAPPVTLREVARPGDISHARVELKAAGKYQPATPPGGTAPAPLELKVETRLEFDERVEGLDPAGAPRRSVRQVVRAGAVINGEVRPTNATLRPELTTLVAERKDGSVAVVSAGGPLTRSELDLVEGPADPLVLSAFLPPDPVAVGAHWTVSPDAARSVSGYDALAANTLEATLEAVDEGSATIRLLGSIRGAVLGGEGSMACDGSLRFDRKAQRVAGLQIRRAETRQPGPVEAGLDVKSTLSVVREDSTNPGVLADNDLVTRAAKVAPGQNLLLFNSADGKYSLLHDRAWHLYWDDPRQAVLKRLDRGELVAQANFSVGPEAGAGRHQDPAQFRDDVRRALGSRFETILGEGVVDGTPGGHYRYKVTARGRAGEAVILWHYYLLASPAGDQLIATFTLGQAQEKAFADQDLLLIGTFEWKSPGR